MKGKPVEFKVIKGILFKRCPRCGAFIEMTKFHVKRDNPHNKQGYCKECNREYGRQWWRSRH